MQNATLKYQPKIAMKHYGIVLALVAITIAALLIGGESWELIILKIPVVPLFFLAWKGLYSLYLKPIYEHKITLRAFECSSLQALVTSFGLLIIMWQPDKSVGELARDYLFTLSWFFVLHMVLLLIQVYRISKGYEKPR